MQEQTTKANANAKLRSINGRRPSDTSLDALIALAWGTVLGLELARWNAERRRRRWA